MSKKFVGWATGSGRGQVINIGRYYSRMAVVTAAFSFVLRNCVPYEIEHFECMLFYVIYMCGDPVLT